MASSSGVVAVTDPKEWDVFISFRGEDTRANFTSHLRDALRRKQIETFVDDKLNRGDEISSALIEAIEDSQISIVVFSENYASSKWCLDELLQIMECRRKEGKLVIPVFYNVEPSHVRYQRGSYEEALTKHEGRFVSNKDKDRVTKWKEAMTEAANLSGFDSRIYRDDAKLVEKIVEDVLSKLEHNYPSQESKLSFGINENLGPIESLFREVETIGIWGMGGIGKTTIARCLFHKYSSQYEGSCFLENVRENSGEHGQTLHALHNKLVSKLLDADERRTNVESTFVKRKLRCKRVLVVLDDVSTSKQIEYLVGELQHSGSGSRIIITTRDKNVLNKGADKIHEVKALEFKESLELFSLKAFNQNHPVMGYEELSKRAVNYAKGVPLALEVLGSFLHSKSESEWESEFEKLKRIPNKGIDGVLKLSYDGLDGEQKEIFLEIAYFMQGSNSKQVTRLLDSYGFAAVIGLRILQDKALITIREDVVRMHDLIQDMGIEIVRQESTKEPGKRSRLRFPEEIYDVLKNNRGTNAVEGIFLDMSKIRHLDLSVDTFKNMTNLRFLCFSLPFSSTYTTVSTVSLLSGLWLFSEKLSYIRWERYPSNSFPLTFCPRKLTTLILLNSQCEKLWDGVQDLENLKIINLSGSRLLKELPDFSKASILEEIYLTGCENLCHVHPSILSLHSLVSLDLEGCRKLKSLEGEIYLPSLKKLLLSGSNIECFPATIKQLTKLELLRLDNCKELQSLPELPQSIQDLYLNGTNIECLPANMEQLTKLVVLCLYECKKLQSLPKLPQSIEVLHLKTSNIDCLPATIKQLAKLKYINLAYCRNLQSLPELPQSIQKLYLNGSNIECLPATIKQLTELKVLHLNDCEKLQSLPELPQSIHELRLDGSNIECLPATMEQLTKLVVLCLFDCKKLRSLPELPQSIEALHLQRSNIECLPATIEQLAKLKYLDLANCKKLQSLPELPQSIQQLFLNGSNIECLPATIKQLTELKILHLNDCEKLQSLPELPQSILELDLDGSNIECFPATIKQLTELKVLLLNNFQKLQSLPEIPHSIQRLYLDGSNIECLPATIKQLTKLEVLDLKYCKKLQSLPELPQSIQELDLIGSNIECLPATIKQLTELKVLHLNNCEKLQSLPELPQSIQELRLDGSNIECLPATIEQLAKLKYLDLANCKKLQSLPDLPQSIQKLDLNGSNIECLPATIKQLTELKVLHLNNWEKLQPLPELPQSIQKLDLNGSNIECLPATIKQLTKLNVLHLNNCEKLQSLLELPQSIRELYLNGSNIECLPATIKQLTKLEVLDLKYCKKLQSLPELPQSIQELDLNGSNIECLPATIKQLTKLKVLHLNNCEKLQSLPELPQSIQELRLDGSNIECLPATIKQLAELEVLDLKYCKKLQSLPELPQSIQELDLNGSNIECLPATIKQLTELKVLHLNNCEKLQSLPELPQSIQVLRLDGSNIECLPATIEQLTKLKYLDLANCKKLQSLPDLPQSIQKLSLPEGFTKPTTPRLISDGPTIKKYIKEEKRIVIWEN